MALDDLDVFNHEAFPRKCGGDVLILKGVHADVVGGEDLNREIDSTSFHVFVDVSEDVDELHLDAEVDGVQAGRAVLIAVDFNEN